MTNPWLAFDDATREKIREVYAAWGRLTARPMRRWDEDVTDIGTMIQALDGNVGPLVAAVEQLVNGHMNRTSTVPGNFRYCLPAMRRVVQDAKARQPQALVHRPPPDFHAEDMGPEPDGAAAKAAIAATLRQLRGGDDGRE